MWGVPVASDVMQCYRQHQRSAADNYHQPHSMSVWLHCYMNLHFTEACSKPTQSRFVPKDLLPTGTLQA